MASRRLTPVLALVALCVLLFFFGLGSRAIWDIDEGKHASTTKVMVQTGDWITPTLDGEPFFDKPILFNWLGAIAFALLGFTEFAARLPAALLGTLGVLSVYWFGRRVFGEDTGFLSGLVLATSLLFIVLSRVVVHDIALAVSTSLCLFFFYLGATEEERRGRWFLLFYVAAGFAVLAKGPLGLALPGLVIGLYLVLTRRLGLVREMRIGWGLLIVPAIALPWYLAISLANPEYPAYFFAKHLAHLGSKDLRHAHGFFYYVPYLIGGTFPWTAFFPLALVRGFRRAFARHAEPDPAADGIRFLLVWIVASYLFFSTASAKLPTYLLPLFPPIALLVAIFLRELATTASDGLRRAAFWLHLPVTLGLWAAFAYAQLEPPVRLTEKYGVDLGKLDIFLLTIAGFAAVALYFLWRRRTDLAAATLVALMACGLVFFTTAFAPDIDPYRAAKRLSARIEEELAPEGRMCFYHRRKDSALFYTDRELVMPETVGDVGRLLAASEPVMCLIDDREMQVLAPLRDRFEVLDREGNTYLISNR